MLRRMRLSLIARWLHVPIEYLRAADAGSGAGASGAASTGSGAQAGAGSGASAGSAGTGTAVGTGTGDGSQPFRLADDALVDLGDGRTGRWSELRDTHFVARDRWDAGVKVLEGEAKKLEDAWTRYYQQQGPKPQQPDPAQQRRDRYGRIKQMPIVDGATLADMAETLEREGLQPIAQTLTALVTRLQNLETRFGQTSQSTAQLAQDRQNSQFNQWVGSDVLGKLERVKGVPEGVSIDTNDPYLRDLVSDVYLSHDQESWHSAKEVRAEVQKRLESAIAFVRNLDKKAVDFAKEKRRAAFTNLTRGNARPSGDAPYRHQRGDELAAMLFGAAEGRQT